MRDGVQHRIHAHLLYPRKLFRKSIAYAEK